PGKGQYDYWVVKTDTEGKKQWDKTFGGDGDDLLTTMVAISDGGYLIGGYSNSRIGGDRTESRGDYDYWIVRIDKDGNKLWDKTFGGTTIDELYSIVPTQDGGYLLGGSSSSHILGDHDVWVLKVDKDGNKLWDKTFQGT